MRRGSKTNRLLDFWVGIPLLNLLATFHGTHSRPSHIHRIGVLCSPALGDTLLFSAVLADLRVAFPAAHIIHFCMKQNLAAAEIIAGADTRVLLNLTNPVASMQLVRAAKVDILLDFSAWQRLTAFLALSSGARFVAGFSTPGQHRARAYDLTVPHRDTQHELENFRDLLRALAIPTTHAPAVILPEPAISPLPGEDDLIVLHLWASGARAVLREWPEDRWHAFAAALAHRPAPDRPGTLFVITGAPADRQRITSFVARLQSAGLRATAFVSPDGFVSLANVIGRARLVASVNTGVMHLAAILGAPTLCLNGPTASHRWGPVGPHALAIAPADGSGGYLNLGFEFGDRTENVMERIPAGQAIAAAETLMAR